MVKSVSLIHSSIINAGLRGKVGLKRQQIWLPLWQISLNVVLLAFTVLLSKRAVCLSLTPGRQPSWAKPMGGKPGRGPPAGPAPHAKEKSQVETGSPDQDA